MSRRKAEMVLELVDRATRPARRIMAVQKKMSAVVKRSNTDAAKSSRLAKRATDLYHRSSKKLARGQERLATGIKRTNRYIDSQKRKLRSSAGMVGKGLVGTGKAALLAGGMFAGYATSVSAAAASLIGPAAQFERYQIQLETLEGSSEKGRKAMEWIEDFATSTPLELNQVVEAYQQLKTFGMDPTNGSMMALVDTMAASGKGVEHLGGLTLALGKSWTKGKLQGEEIMMLMERGVPVYDILGKKMGKTAEQIMKMGSAGKLGKKEIQILIDEMGRMNAGASDRMSKTWDGIISNLNDKWTKFRRMIADAGVFDEIKGKLRQFLEYFDKLDESGKLQEYADIVAQNILTGLKAVWNFGKSAYHMWQSIYPWIKWSADALGGWRNLALALVAIPMRGVLFGAAAGFFQIGLGAAGAGRALMGISFGGIAKGALRASGSVLSLLNPLKLVRGALFAVRIAFIATGIGALVAGLAMAGVWIYNNWSGLTSFFKGFGQGFMNALGPAAPLAEGVVNAVKKVWDWLGKLLGPLDATEAQWAHWGTSVGTAVADVVNYVMELPGKIKDSLASGWATVSAWTSEMWAGLSDCASAAWDGLKFLLLNYTPHGLIYTHWDSIAAFFSEMWSGLTQSASLAWDGLKFLLLNYTPQGLIYTHWDGIAAFFSGMWEGVKAIFTDAWAFIYDTVIVPMQKAVAFMTDNKLTRGLSSAGSAVVGFFSGDDDAQTNARGGSFGPGWHLTGEQGAELKYESQSGYVAHNRALQRMVAMSREVAAQSRRMPSVGRSLAFASGLTAVGAAPAVATGTQYLTANSTAGSSHSTSISLTVQGNVDQTVMPDLEAAMAEAERRVMAKIEAKVRTSKRREHS